MAATSEVDNVGEQLQSVAAAAAVISSDKQSLQSGGIAGGAESAHSHKLFPDCDCDHVGLADGRCESGRNVGRESDALHHHDETGSCTLALRELAH